MAKPEWGTKRICLSCGARFYDMQRDPIVCPSCGTTHDPQVQARPRRTRAVAAPKLVAVPAEEPELESPAVDEEEDVEVDEDEEDPKAAVKDDDEDEDEDETENAIEDVSELGDDDDVADVIETDIDEDERGR